VSGAERITFRAARIGVVLYIALPLPAGAIRRIVIGPGEHPETRVEGVRTLIPARVPLDTTPMLCVHCRREMWQHYSQYYAERGLSVPEHAYHPAGSAIVLGHPFEGPPRPQIEVVSMDSPFRAV
jgi:hypothetical protein